MKKILSLAALLLIGGTANAAVYDLSTAGLDWTSQQVWSNVTQGTFARGPSDNGDVLIRKIGDSSTWTNISNAAQTGTYSGIITTDGSDNIISGTMTVTGTIANAVANTFWGHQYDALTIDFAAGTATATSYICEDVAPPVGCLITIPSVGTFPGGGDAAPSKVFAPTAGLVGAAGSAHSGATFDGTTLEIFREAWSGSEADVTEYLNTWTASPVPVPAAVWLFGSALGLLGWMRRRA